MVKTDISELVKRGRAEPGWFMSNVLDVKSAHLWPKMTEMLESCRDFERTTIGAGHGVSKTYTMGRLCLWFLYCYYPSTVVTTAPTGEQVKNLLWREIRQSHANAKIPLGGKLTTTMLDLQAETGIRWFATGFSTRPDTVTTEATAFQGYHNDHLLIIFDEAAGILPEIWRASEHIGAPFKRFIAVGNPTSAWGDFASSLKDDSFNRMKISVTDTPNFKEGREVIPGVYGKTYEERIRLKYGVNSDDYKVRVLGEISARKAEGAYYAKKMNFLRSNGRITDSLEHNPNYPVYIVEDIGYTSAIGFFQSIEGNVNFINYYEDSGQGVEDYVRLFDTLKKDFGYRYGDIFVPCDMDSNAHKVITGETALTTLRAFGYSVKPLPREGRVKEGIARTFKFLDRCRFHKTRCERLIECLEGYHERKNKLMSTEDKTVFTGVPEKDGTDHAADMLRYASLAAARSLSGGMTAEMSRELWLSHIN